jgi:hypothetical protein
LGLASYRLEIIRSQTELLTAARQAMITTFALFGQQRRSFTNLYSDLVGLVEKLCEPLFVLFNFAHFERKKYEGSIVANFIAGKVA